jgi:hypothetical protein
MGKLGAGLFAAALALSALACQVNIGGPDAPASPEPDPSQGSEPASEAWESALSSALETGQLVVLLTEAQVTALLQQRLERQTNPVLRDPQVTLRDGVMRIYGTTEQGPLQASVQVTIAPRLKSDGTIFFEVTDADFGPFPVPEGARQSISTMLTEAFTSPMGSLATGIRITSIAIADGQIAIVGELR